MATLLAPSAGHGASGEAEVRVLGRITLESRRLHVLQEARLEGLIKDELGRPLPAASLHFETPVRVCGGSEALTSIPARPDGSFCVVLGHAQLEQELTVRSPDHVDFSTTPAALPESQLEPRAEFSSPEYLWELGSGESSLEVGARGTGFPPLSSFELHLECGAKAYSLGEFVAAQDGTTFIRLAERRELPTGRCTLSLLGRHDGTSLTTSASAAVTLERAVQLSLLSENAGSYEVSAKTLDGTLATGMLEARGRDGRYLAGAKLLSGLTTLDLAHLPHEDITFHFVPGAPWFRAGSTLTVRHEPRPGWYWDGRLHLAALVAFLAWLGRRLLKKSSSSFRSDIGEVGRLQLTDAPREKTIRGTIRDAHTSESLVARVDLYEKATAGGELLETAVTTENGCFEFPVSSVSLLELVVTSDRHITLVAPVRQGSVEVSLVSRRRALLRQVESLLRARPDLRTSPATPTPEQLRREAAMALRAPDESWAANLNRLAYGPDEPGEAEVSALTLPAAPTSSRD